jgi:putative membrane protein
VIAHRACQIAALCVSLLFLASYLTYHYHHGATRFLGTGLVRPIYFTVLTSHTILAIAIVPLVILTFYRAFRGDLSRHRRIARITLPLWLALPDLSSWVKTETLPESELSKCGNVLPVLVQS